MKRKSSHEINKSLSERQLQDGSSDEGEGTFVQYNDDAVVDHKIFKPFYMISVLGQRRTAIIRLSVGIALPSGVGCNEYSIRVLERVEKCWR